jgi:hypothetical protein
MIIALADNIEAATVFAKDPSNPGANEALSKTTEIMINTFDKDKKFRDNPIFYRLLGSMGWLLGAGLLCTSLLALFTLHIF